MRALCVAVLVSGCRLHFDEISVGDAGTDQLTPGVDAGPYTLIPRSVLQLDRVDPGEMLVDFPLMVTLDDAHVDRALMQADASDLRIFDDSGIQLDLELEQTTVGAPIIAWVRVPFIKGLTTTLLVDYGRPNMPPPMTAVWAASYVGVYHFADLAPLADSSPNHHDLTAIGSSQAPGFIARGRAFVGSAHEALRIPYAPTTTLPVVTISGLMRETTVPTGGVRHAFVAREYVSTNYREVWLGDDSGTIGVGVTVTGPAESFTGGIVGAANIWSSYAFTATDTLTSIYVDGAFRAGGGTSTPLTHSMRPIYLGANVDVGGANPTTDWLDGTLDEIRIENIVRDAAWIKYDAKSVRDGLITYGAVMP